MKNKQTGNPRKGKRALIVLDEIVYCKDNITQKLSVLKSLHHQTLPAAKKEFAALCTCIILGGGQALLWISIHISNYIIS
jgi:hypothetical protein